MTTISTKHPQYLEVEADWKLMDDSLSERRIKKETTLYLPKTTGQLIRELENPLLVAAYVGYQMRAGFPEITEKAISSMVGIAHRQDGVVTSSDRIDTDHITVDGHGINELARRCTRKVVKDGRIGLLVDVDTDGQPYIAMYDATSIINWQSKVIDGEEVLTLVVLVESAKNDDDIYSHETTVQYRVLSLTGGAYVSALFDENGDALAEPVQAQTASRKTLNYIPFVTAGSIDTTISVDALPLLPMARSAIKIYQLDADYKQSLHMTSEPTPVLVGDPSEDIDTIGSSVIWKLAEGGKAFFLEVSGNGLDAQRLAISDEMSQAEKFGASLGKSTGTESGEALSIRMFSQHATLYSSVNAIGQALTKCLQWAHEIIGVSTDDVSYIPNSDFTQVSVDTALINAMNAAINAGNVPREILFELLRDANMTDRDDDELASLIESGGFADTEGV